MFEAFFLYKWKILLSEIVLWIYQLVKSNKEWSILLDEAVSLLEKYKFVIMEIRDFARHFYLLIFI